MLKESCLESKINNQKLKEEKLSFNISEMTNQIESLTNITDTIYEKDELSKLLTNEVKDLEASLKNLNDEKKPKLRA